MKLLLQTPIRSLNKAFLKHRPLRSEIDLFKSNLLNLLSKIDEIEREENQKNHIRDFLRDTFYKDSNEINTKNNKDLVIHLGKTNKDKVGIIIEAKRPGNKYEMLSLSNINVKALHELVLYYLQERIEAKNDEIKYCIATNIYEWFIIDSYHFENIFYRNKSFVKEYEKWRDNQKVSSDTKHFYEAIAKPFIETLDIEIPCTYFDIRDYKEILTNTDKEDDKNLTSLYKILSPYHLLKVPFSEDSNKLDEKFYKELLHIIGLEEVKVGSKYTIKRKVINRDSASLLEQVYDELNTVGLHKVINIYNYGETIEDQLFNISVELSLTWINRILFLKLLEGQLIKFHRNSKEFHFLNYKTIYDFDELYKLFHKVLAVKETERTAELSKKYWRIPYLNSSLFEISELEDQTITINSLDNSLRIKLINTTILNELRKNQEDLPVLDYIFRFLNSYDFASEGYEDIEENRFKPLINASVLGKVFEKINGYKEGSIYTPGIITMYMCKQSIRLAVIQKFKDKYNWKIKKFIDLKNYLADRRSSKEILTFNQIINSLRICDPAVGSGHYLVSCLNEIIQVKYELGLLADSEGNRFANFEISIVNDELFITYINGELFQYQIVNYKPLSNEIQRFQKVIFHEKQTIIENCLFGVDLNPNSVKICRLRLWIELLKNAYYKEDEFKELETLPNIDINIKCGNSLISRFSITDNLDYEFNRQKFNLRTYKLAINSYRNSTNRGQRRELISLIEKIKNNYTEAIYQSDPRRKKIAELRGQLTLVKSNYDLFGKKISDKDALYEEIRLNQLIDQKLKELENTFDNKVFQNAFEWRFEFPEVLDDKGIFLGFDVVIGNPPYIESRSAVISDQVKDAVLKNIKLRRKKDAVFITRGSDILIYFFELGLNIIKKNGYFSFITQNAWLDTDYGFKFQNFLRRNTEIIGIFDNDIKYFDESANINTIITLFKGNQGNENNKINFVRFNVGFDQAPYEPIEISTIKEKGKVLKIRQNDELLNQLKWGIILNSDDIILDLYKRLFESSNKIETKLQIGQGLNLTRDYIVNQSDVNELNLKKDNLVPFFTNDDGAPFIIDKTANFLLIDKDLSINQHELMRLKGIKISELKNSQRQIPSLILPRGIGRYFCAINNCSSYSSSFVEIYLPDNENYNLYIKYLWLFLNSSIGWLIREISGRKNLGGGMLKAEATDLRNYPILFDFSVDLDAINKIYFNLSKRQAENASIEIFSEEHQKIDEIVFNFFGYSKEEKEKIVFKLAKLIRTRVTKSKTRI